MIASQPLRVALIGCGEIGVVRAEALSQTPAARLVAACDVDRSRARSVADRFGCAKETDWRHVITRDDVDVVNVATPTAWHAEMGIAAAGARKHLLVEKPLARSVQEAQDLVSAAEAANVRLKTGFNHRYYQAVIVAKDAFDSGRLGELMFVRSYIGHEGGDEFLGKWMTRSEIAGGGTLLDNGIHILDLTRFFLGEVAEAEGLVATSKWDVGPLEDNAFALFRSPAGKIATVTSSWTEWAGYRFMIEAYGTLGYARAAYPPMRATVGINGASGRPARKKLHLFPWFQIRERVQGYWLTTRLTFIREFEDLARVVRHGGPVFSNGYDGLRATQMAFAVYESATRGVRVRL